MNRVIIEEVKFRTRNINWKEVERELNSYVSKEYTINEINEIIHIDKDFPDEFSHSQDSLQLVGANKKAKANMVTIIGELINNAINCAHYPDYEKRHGKKASNGWNRYDIGFSLPVYDEKGDIVKYNNYSGRMVVRCDEKGWLYLYDFVRIRRDK